MYDSIQTEQEKAKRRKELHARRPDLGAVNDRRKLKAVSTAAQAEIEDEELIERINKRLEAREEGVITVTMLADKHALEPRKLRAIIRKLGFEAPKEGGIAQYRWDPDSFELHQIETALKKKTSTKR